MSNSIRTLDSSTAVERITEVLEAIGRMFYILEPSPSTIVIYCSQSLADFLGADKQKLTGSRIDVIIDAFSRRSLPALTPKTLELGNLSVEKGDLGNLPKPILWGVIDNRDNEGYPSGLYLVEVRGSQLFDSVDGNKQIATVVEYFLHPTTDDSLIPTLKALGLKAYENALTGFSIKGDNASLGSSSNTQNAGVPINTSKEHMNIKQTLVERIDSLNAEEQQALLTFADAVFPSTNSAHTQSNESDFNTHDFLEKLPPGPRSAATWDDLERELQESRNSWGS